MLHNEVDHVASLATGEAFIHSFCRRHRERWCAVVVEGAQTFITRATLAQRHEVGDDVDDVRRVHDTVYGRSVNHVRISFQPTKIR